MSDINIKMDNTNFTISRLLPAIGIILFIFLAWNTGFSKLTSTIINLDIRFFLFAILLNAVAIPIKAMKWKMIINSCAMNYPLHKCISSWIIGYSAGLITPGRMGDFYRSFYLKSFGNNSIGLSMATVIIDRITDILIMIALALIGALILADKFLISLNLTTIISPLVISFGLIMVFLKKETTSGVLRPLFYKLVPIEKQANIRLNFYEFFNAFGRVYSKKAMIIIMILLGIIAWAIVIIQNYLLLLALNVKAPFLFIACITPFISVVEILPISISGIGTRDAALIFFLGLLLIPPEIAISLSLSMILGGYIVGLVGFIIWSIDSRVV